MHKIVTFFSVLLFSTLTVGAHSSELEPFGIRFDCSPQERMHLQHAVQSYVHSLGATDFVDAKEHSSGTFSLTLKPQYIYGNTLTFFTNPIFSIAPQKTPLLHSNGSTKMVHTVSEKETLLTLLAPGRLTLFKSQTTPWQMAGVPNVVGGCDPHALKEHIQLRQMVSAWSQKLSWGWPDGGSAQWNARYWNKGTPILPSKNPAQHLVHSVRDMFIAQHRYSIGCYTAAKMVYVQAYLDYYARINPQPKKLQAVYERLMTPDQEPLVDIEPQKMWYFESDYAPKSHLPEHSGKLLVLQEGVSWSSFVPGDWAYMRNTDPATQEKTGYEGSNAIYLGGNLFDDFYNDHAHGYPFERKLDEVYQWRNQVFSRSQHAHKITPLTDAQKDTLKYAPSEGGLLESYRAVPFVPSVP